MAINYIGEHLLAGNLGRLSILISFISAVAAAILYTLAASNDQRRGLRKAGRTLFFVHAGFLLLSVILLYYLIFIHAFEYQYVSGYSSRKLPFAYLLSSFWAGQEGSFMLWALFQAMLAFILLRRIKDWESPTFSIISLSQAFLMLMLLGWTISGVLVGTDPFQLLRNMPENQGQTFYLNPNYLEKLEGQGLNPLLENIWMAIHPPLLFLGYAAVLIPFALAMAGLWKKDLLNWRNKALVWLNFSGLSLGVGIILGGAWAYVSLTFGGFWAWDPVENASLVPWLFVIATIHVLLISRKKPGNMVWVYLFSILSYFFVLYASYLTRSGVLSNASAHAFGDEGKAFFLVLYMLTFLVMGLVLLIKNYRQQPSGNKENLSSKEFWVFIGSLVLALSSFQIILTTSIPVFNKLLGLDMAPPSDSVAFYNSWQLPYGILIALMVGFSQYVRYNGTPTNEIIRRVLKPLIVSLAITILFIFIYPFKVVLHYFFLFFLLFMLYASIESLFNRKKKQRNLGALVTHLGMSLFLLGVLITFSHTRVISKKTQDPVLAQDNMSENTILFRNDTIDMSPYKVIYKTRTEKENWLHYSIEFLRQDGSGRWTRAFDLNPAINRNLKMGNVHEPDTRHLLTKDIYGYISYAQNSGYGAIDGYTLKKEYELGLHEAVICEGVQFTFDSVAFQAMDAKLTQVNVQARITAVTSEDTTALWIHYNLGKESVTRIDDTLPSKEWILRFNQVKPTGDKIIVDIYEKGTDYIVMKVTVFPFISLMWIGTVITFAGLLLAVRKRLKKKNPKEIDAEPSEPLAEPTREDKE